MSLPSRKVSDESLGRDETSFVKLATKLSQVTVNFTLYNKLNFFMFVLLLSYHTVFLIYCTLKLTYTCEFFKKLKLHSSKWLVQFPLFEKLTHANEFQIELETR